VLVLGTYVLIFLALFWGIRAGVGQYWDWSFPYFRDQIHNLFANQDSSWTQAKGGSPLGYSSDYFFRFFISLFVFLQPETLHYLLLVGLFAVTALGMYLLVRPHTSRGLAFLLGLVACINPAIFYKYTAGHFDYFLSFPLFIYMIHYLLRRFHRNLRSAVVVGLFMAFIGAQIQFFVIAGAFLVLFLLWNREKASWKYVPIIFGLPAFINLIWLMNFMSGAASTAQIGATAAKVSFKALSASSFLNIFTFNFSQATLLNKFFAFYELLWNGALFIFLFWLLANGRRKERFDVLLLIFLAIMIFMATGMYQMIAIYPLTILYPMLREVGHFAPIIVLIALLIIARLAQQRVWRWALLVILIGSLFIVAAKFEYYSQGYNFAAVRQQFASFKKIADNDTGSYRVLAYPFFSQYALNNVPQDPAGQLPLRNTGHDSFSGFAKQSFIDNAVAPYQFRDSPQYELLQTYNIDVLRPWGVKYIFDFSGIYTSDYNLYVPASIYNNDLSLIKNDPHFFDKLLAHNPGRLRKINAHVLEVTDYAPRVSAVTKMFSVSASNQTQEADIFTRSQLGQAFDFTPDDPSLTQYTTHLTQLFGSPDNLTPDKANSSFNQTVQIPTGTQATLYASQSYQLLSYTATATKLIVYTHTTPPLWINGTALGGMNAVPPQVLTQVTLQRGIPYYLSVNGRIIAISPGSSGNLGTFTVGDTVQILSGGANNIVNNPSFEQDLWEQHVRDCNAYNDAANMGMSRSTSTASDGHASLELSATRHDACTATGVTLDKNAQYLLSFDYQSDNAPTASYFLAFADQTIPLSKGSHAITGRNWHTATELINTGDQSGYAQLFLYALEGDGQHATINHYDNVRLVRLMQVTSATLAAPSAATQYAKLPLSPGEQKFTFQDPSYHYQNLIANPSFEQGSWQSAVSDCNAYDSLPKISMRLDSIDKSVGKQSLELSAGHHDACVHTTADVRAGVDYLLSFDYEVASGNTYGYTASFDDPRATTNRDQLISSGSSWHTAHIKIHAPQGATTLTLYLYAFESNGHSPNIVRYDNVDLAELPDFANRFFVVTPPAIQLAAPKSLSFSLPSQSMRTIHVASATTPFFVELSESYHPKWQLELNNSSVDGLLSSWLPNVVAATSGMKHIELSGATNGWLVDPIKACQVGRSLRVGCSKNADGSYNLELKAEFVPQRWFAVAVVTSWITIFVSTTYLILVRPKQEPTYRRHA
jgi:hypothetical protein